MEKASFTRLNKLFEMSASEQDHQVFLTYKNLQAVVKKSKSFIILILHRLVSQSLVPSEHHLLKDLLFYEVARVADLKARLEQREKKCKDKMLRQAPTTNSPTSNSIVRPPVKKKKGPITQSIQRSRTPPSASSSSPFASFSSLSSSSLATSTEPDSRVDWSTSNVKLKLRLSWWCPPPLVKRKKIRTWLQT